MRGASKPRGVVRIVKVQLTREVYRTVRLRDKTVNATWAPWWRAQAEAIAHVAFLESPDVDKRDKFLARERRFATSLEERD